MPSLEGGGWKSANTGNSLATYPTARLTLLIIFLQNWDARQAVGVGFWYSEEVPDFTRRRNLILIATRV